MSPTLLRRTLIVVVTAIVLVAVVLFAARIPHTIAIFLIAAFIAFGALPLVTRLEERMPRPLAIALVYAGLMSALVLLALVVIPISYAQILALVGHTPEYLAWSGDVVRRSEGALRHLLGNRVPLPSYTDMQAEAGVRLSAFITAAVASLG
ncbi:MAG TPA: AI-2E family transporter, partial [Candidatus Elarobacter sp.]|nr:AI-2E family transporter [Candidatus Elarobacter sp.]